MTQHLPLMLTSTREFKLEQRREHNHAADDQMMHRQQNLHHRLRRDLTNVDITKINGRSNHPRDNITEEKSGEQGKGNGEQLDTRTTTTTSFAAVTTTKTSSSVESSDNDGDPSQPQQQQQILQLNQQLLHQRNRQRRRRRKRHHKGQRRKKKSGSKTTKRERRKKRKKHNKKSSKGDTDLDDINTNSIWGTTTPGSSGLFHDNDNNYNAYDNGGKDPTESVSCTEYDFRNVGQQLTLGDIGGTNTDDCSTNVLELMKSIPTLSTMVYMIRIANIDSILSTCIGPFTILAPTNDAWEKQYKASTFTNLLRHDNRQELRDILFDHIVPGLWRINDLDSSAQSLTSLSAGNHNDDNDMIITLPLNPLRFNNAAVLSSQDIVGCNGAVFVLDEVLRKSPPTPPSPSHQDESESESLTPTLRIVPAPMLSPTFVPTYATIQPTIAIINSPSNVPTYTTTTRPTIATIYSVSPSDYPSTAPSSTPSFEPQYNNNNTRLQLPPTIDNVQNSSSHQPSLSSSPVAAQSSFMGTNSSGNSTRSIPTLKSTSLRVPTISPHVATAGSSNQTTIIQAPSSPPVAFPPPISTNITNVTVAVDTTSSEANVSVSTTPSNVRVHDFFIVYRAPDATVSPTELQFEAMRQRTAAYYDTYLANYFRNNTSASFIRFATTLKSTDFDVEAKADGFNILMQYDYADVEFRQGTENSPDVKWIIDALKKGITVQYIVDIVRTMLGTPFESTVEVFLSTLQ